MIRALLLGFRHLSEPAAQRLILRCVLTALGTFLALFALVAAVLFGIDLTGWMWVDSAIAVAGSAAALLLSWLLFPVVVSAILGLFAEGVADAVESRHYPQLPAARGMSMAAQIGATARFVVVALALNLLVLPLYLVPGINLPVYLGLNGYLLGREYFELVAGRRMSMRAVTLLRRRWRARLWLAGVMIAGMLAVPLFNLIAPVVAVAFMVHLLVALVRADPDVMQSHSVVQGTGEVRPASDGNV